MPKKNPHPYVAWRAGRPRFVPAQNLRAMGYEGRDLRHDDGAWYSKGEAVDWSLRFRRELKKKQTAEGRKGDRPSGTSARPAGGPASAASARPVRHYTVAHMLEDWQRSPKWRAGEKKAYAPNTRRDYRQKIGVLEVEHPLVWNAPAHLVKRQTLRAVYEELWEKRGLATARGVIATLSVAFSWAVLRGKVKRPDNPALKLAMDVPDARVRFATRKELTALVKAADEAGRAEIGDMILLAVWTGQRQADRLELTAHARLSGRRIFRQAKTGAIVAIREAPELEARLAAAGKRRAAARAAALLAAGNDEERKAIELRFAHVVLDEAVDTRPGRGKQRWLPFSTWHYGHTFAKIREAAAKACPSVADLRDQDLRDTAVTWMALAGATIPEIIAVTGHTPQSATQILKHYLARHPEMADEAIGKMMAWYEGGGETEFGL